MSDSGGGGGITTTKSVYMILMSCLMTVALMTIIYMIIKLSKGDKIDVTINMFVGVVVGIMIIVLANTTKGTVASTSS